MNALEEWVQLALPFMEDDNTTPYYTRVVEESWEPREERVTVHPTLWGD